MSDLGRAILQYGCEATIYTCQRILEHLAATRPNMDDPLPDDMQCFTVDRGGRMESDGPMASQLLPDDFTYPDWLNSDRP